MRAQTGRLAGRLNPLNSGRAQQVTARVPEYEASRYSGIEGAVGPIDTLAAQLVAVYAHRIGGAGADTFAYWEIVSGEVKDYNSAEDFWV